MLIKIENLQKGYKIRNGLRRIVFENLNFTIFEHDFICIRGPSGVGKTTFLRILGKEIQPDKGYVFYNLELEQRPENIIYVQQEPKLKSYLTVKENLLDISDNENYINSLLDKLNLKQIGFHYKDEISGGELVRVSICRALLMKPKLLLLDEPTANLDIKTKEILLSFIKDLWLNSTITIIIASHDEEIKKYTNNEYSVEQNKILLM